MARVHDMAIVKQYIRLHIKFDCVLQLICIGPFGRDGFVAVFVGKMSEKVRIVGGAS